MHLAGQGTDAGKRITGRKPHPGCDTLGLLLTVLVTAASVSDTAAGVTLLSRIAAAHPHVRKAMGRRRLPRHRRLARDYEQHPHRSEALIHFATIDLMARCLTAEATPTGAEPDPGPNARCTHLVVGRPVGIEQTRGSASTTTGSAATR